MLTTDRSQCDTVLPPSIVLNSVQRNAFKKFLPADRRDGDVRFYIRAVDALIGCSSRRELVVCVHSTHSPTYRTYCLSGSESILTASAVRSLSLSLSLTFSLSAGAFFPR